MWIETFLYNIGRCSVRSRLARALWIETIRKVAIPEFIYVEARESLVD